MSGSGTEGIARSRAKFHRDATDEDVDLRQTEPNLMPSRETSRNRTSFGNFNVFNMMLGLGVSAFLVTLLLICDLMNLVQEAKIPRVSEEVNRPLVVTPFPASKLVNSHQPQFQGENKEMESLYWGTYRPRVYHGIRARTRRSLIAGLMWIGIKDGRYFLRHVCQDSDELSIYSWTHNNFEHQFIVEHGMNLATSFFKSTGEDSGYGGDWAVRIDVQKSKGNEEFWRNAHLFFYLADEDGNPLTLGEDTLGVHENSLLASGLRTDVGSWQLHLKSMDELDVHYSGFRMPHIHNLSDIVHKYLRPQEKKFGQLELPDTSDDSPNILVFQISARIPFKTDIAFISGTDLESSRVEERVSSLTGTSLTSQLREKQRELDTKFEKSFNLAAKVDQATDELNKHAPPGFAKQVGSQAHGFILKAWEKTQTIVKDAQTAEARTAIHSAATEYKQFLFNQTTKLWVDQYPKVQSVAEKASTAASHWFEKYNHMVNGLNVKGYNISGYLPFVPTWSKGNAGVLVEHKSDSDSD